MEWVSQFIRSGSADADNDSDNELSEPESINEIEITIPEAEKTLNQTEPETFSVPETVKPVVEPEAVEQPAIEKSEEQKNINNTEPEKVEEPVVEKPKPKRKRKPMTEARKAQLAKAREKARDSVKRRKAKMKELELMNNEDMLEKAVSKVFDRLMTKRASQKKEKPKKEIINTSPPSPPKLQRTTSVINESSPSQEAVDFAKLLGY